MAAELAGNLGDVATVVGAVDAATGGSGVMFLLGATLLIGLLYFIMKFVKETTTAHATNLQSITDKHSETVKHVTERMADSFDKQTNAMTENTKAISDLRVAVASNHNST